MTQERPAPGGSTTVPDVPGGAWIAITNPAWPLAHLTEISPCGVGTAPSAQLRVPGCGAIRHLAYPGLAGVTPST